ncbi:MAG: serine hydrolase, partial [Pseudomonadota bacterium]
VVIQGGALVHETYRRGMGPRDPHILMSVSKSMLGLVAGTLVERGELREDALATEYVPELAGTVYEDATIRNMLDMRVGVLFDEDYLATDGPIIDYRYAANWNPVPEGRDAGDLRAFMSKLTARDGGHGERFHYVSPNTDCLAWVMERASGMRYADLVSEHLWKPLGAETPGYVTVDRLGGARAAGGKCFTARDLARVGAMMANGGRRGDGRQVIPEVWIDDIAENGDVEAWRTGDFYEKFGKLDMHYRSKWYVQRGEEPLIHGLGIHGQYVFVDRRRNLSIAWFSSRHEPISEDGIGVVLSAVNRIREAAS